MKIITLLKVRNKYTAVIGGIEVSGKDEKEAREKAIAFVLSDPLVSAQLAKTRDDECAWWAAKLKIVIEGRIEQLEQVRL